MDEIKKTRELLLDRLGNLDNKSQVLRAPELRELYGKIKDQPDDKKAEFGQAINQLKNELEELIAKSQDAQEERPPIDVTSPMDVNAKQPGLLPSNQGSIHPISREIAVVTDIFYRMGFNVEPSREIDDTFHMFDSLNFPKGHPARDDYDTFVTVQKSRDGEPFIAPAHTSTMQNRVLKKYTKNLENNEPIAVVVPDRVFRNEDVDARHEHTFYQIEGVYVGKGVHAGMLIATLKEFLQSYYGKELEYRTQPYYFPFTEPSFEFALSCPFCDKKGCKVCSYEGWIELLGCGMIHPNVLKAADIDPEIYTGFAWGCGIDRLVMIKHDIEDVRHFESAKLDFLRQF